MNDVANALPVKAVDAEADAAFEAELKQFLDGQVLFRGPDPEIMSSHTLAPLSDLERRSLTKEVDIVTKTVIRNRLQMIANEANEILSHIGSAPGAKWGDLICAIFTSSGDLSIASSNGVLLFSVLAHHPIKYILKYWKNEPTVGVREGDIFMHNDARFGNIHNTDQSCLVPIFHEGQLVAWAGSIIHEGENGACEPGGMPSAAESPYDEGLKISPMRCGENFKLREDLVTYFQNSVRDPKLQLEDMRAKLAANMRMRARFLEVIAEYGLETVIGTMREALDSTAEEVARRIGELPDGKVRYVHFADGTLRENVVVKINCCVEVKGKELVIDFRGSSPEFLNRANNTVLCSLKGMVSQVFLNYVWPDLPRNQAILVPVRFLTDERSALNCSPEAPNAQSMMTFFPSFTAVEHCLMKFLFNNACNDNPAKATEVHAAWWNMISGFIYGGLTQHGFFVGNITTDINGMGGGARRDRDGEHTIAPIFGAYVDLGETELLEHELPMVGLVYRKLLKDNQGFGKYRGGHGHMQVLTYQDSPVWAFMNCSLGSKFPSSPGLFGGYSSHCYPLCKVKGTNVLAELAEDPSKATFDIVEIMNKRPFHGEYSTQHTGLQLEFAQTGELYMQSQGCGAGYGDVLERDPELVMNDLRDGLISEHVAREIYKVAYDGETLLVDAGATDALRNGERKARIARGKPFAEFEREWTTALPPANVPFYGCWDDKALVYAGNPERKMPASALQGVML
jgi:N-methylhydantoinase B/oxoprolinase/acetone carboxylase alpha subunit